MELDKISDGGRDQKRIDQRVPRGFERITIVTLHFMLRVTPASWKKMGIST